MANKKPEQLSVIQGLQQLRAGIKSQATEPNIYAYAPHEKQRIFHQSIAKKKLYIGGNRSGKTTGAVVEDLQWVMGNHPYRDTPDAPIRGRVVGVDFLQGVQKILLPQFQRWCPPSILKKGSWEDSYNKELRTLYFANGSFIEFMSYDQDTDKFAGTSRHFIHYDEEPPKYVFNECNARLVDTNGSWWISMTPVDGMTWIYEDIYQEAGKLHDGTLIIEADMQDNPHISKEAAENYLSGLDDDERVAREHGKFVQVGGRVYKTFDRATHVVPPILPSNFSDWMLYSTMDHGFKNPTAWLWHLVSPEGDVITFAEHYKSEWTVEEHARAWHDKNTSIGRQPDIIIGDPSIAQRNGITGTSIQTEYAVNGVYISPGNNDVAVGVAKVNQYFRINKATRKPAWTVTENCTNLIRELEHLRWATYSSKRLQFEKNPQEAIHKKDDHASDALRYMLSFMPDLKFFDESLEGQQKLRPEIQGSKVGVPATGQIDQILAKMIGQEASYHHSEQTVRWIKQSAGTDVGALEYDF